MRRATRTCLFTIARSIAKYAETDFSRYIPPTRRKYDAVVVGGGHNGLVHAAYLAKAGLRVLVLERRHLVGGAAVTEELISGFKFSRGSYLAGLMRPQVVSDLELKKYGLRYLQRTPSSFTPTLHSGRYLMLGHKDMQDDLASIAQFSAEDAASYVQYENFMSQVRAILQPLLDMPPIAFPSGHTRWRELVFTFRKTAELFGLMWKHRDALVGLFQLLMGPAKTILDQYFNSDILKATLATDAVIGAVTSPSSLGSAYVLVHHVMGTVDGRAGVWAYVEGGMGALSEAIAASARASGAEIVCNAHVDGLLYNSSDDSRPSTTNSAADKRVIGVVVNGTPIEASVVISAVTPYMTFLEMGSFSSSSSSSSKAPGTGSASPVAIPSPLPKPFLHHLRHTDYSCGAMKINLAVNRLPNFSCYPSPADGVPGPMHRGTIHFESSVDELERAYEQAKAGFTADVPVIEMTIPSALDYTIAPPGQHVVQLFINYAPYDLNPSYEGGWDNEMVRDAFVRRIYDRFVGH